MPLITIGLPVYNGEKFLDEALSSLCIQTFSNLEILVSDNNSTDTTPQIIKKWMNIDKRIKYFKQTENIGGPANFEWVINNTNSKWFMFAAYDDFWSNNYIEDLYNALKSNPKAIMSVPKTIILDENDQPKYIRSYLPPSNQSSTFDKIKHSFLNINSGWYYGLYDRVSLVNAHKEVKFIKQGWSADFSVLLPFLFSTDTVGCDTAIYYKRTSKLSDERYRPKSARDQYYHYLGFWKDIAIHLNRNKSLSNIEKIRLIPSLYKFARNAGKPQRIMKTYIKECYRAVTNSSQKARQPK